MSPPSRDELREKLAVAAESAKTSVGGATNRLRELIESRPGLARTIGGWAIVVVVGLGLIGIAVGQSGNAESERGGQLVLPAITGTPRATERDTAPGTGAPPNPGAPPDPGRPAAGESAQPDPQAAGAPPAATPSPTPSSPSSTPSSAASPTAVPGVPGVPAQRDGAAQPGPPPSTATPNAPEEQPAPTEHVVSRGETLAKIALRYGVPFEQIAADSGVTNPNRIRAGQRLVIGQKPSGVEVIQPGRTLSDYARSSGRGLDELMRMNPQLANPNRILAGGRLYV